MTDALVASWDLIVQHENYVLVWRGESHVVTSAEAPLGIATDAACDFMDRCVEENIPPFVNNHEELMQFCVAKSWKQR